MKLKNFLLLFACLYAWLYIFPSPLDEVPGLDLIFSPYKDGLEMLTLWFGKSVMGLSDLKRIQMTGSGDTTFDYVLIPVKLLLALLLTLGTGWWLLRDANRFGSFKFWTRTAVRWYLGLYMMIYGVAKLVENGQFSSPGLFDLNQRFGDFSPMGLLWRFMGYSHAYAAFTGSAEVLAGALLLFRRTTMLGSLLTVAVMTHVFMLNMCFDVPVKLFSFHLILLAFGLLAQNLPNLWRFFILNQAVAPVREPDRLNKRWMVITRHALRVLFVGAMIFSVLYFTFGVENTNKNKGAFRGMYDVRQFQYGAQQSPADSLLWNRVVVDYNRMVVFMADNSKQSYKISADSLSTNFTLQSYRDSTERYSFAATRDSNILTINGLWKGDTLYARLRQLDDNKLQLTSRGFHWINEYPYNR